MKTNQLMKRDDGFVQRTKDYYFNANELLSYNNKVGKSKSLRGYTQNNSYTEFIEQLQSEGIEKPVITTTGRNGGTWMHPKLFIDFAMWVSVKFKSKVIDYVLDGLVVSRNDAGDYYNQMSEAILHAYSFFYGKKPPAHVYINEAKLVRGLVTEKRDRNEMTEQELKQITYLQKVNANLIRKNLGKDARIKRLIEASEINI